MLEVGKNPLHTMLMEVTLLPETDYVAKQCSPVHPRPLVLNQQRSPVGLACYRAETAQKMRTETFLNPFATTFNQVRQRLIRWQHHPTGIINQRCLPGRAWAWRVSSTGNSRALTSAPAVSERSVSRVRINSTWVGKTRLLSEFR